MAEKENCVSRPPDSEVKIDEADFTAVVFHEVCDIYPPDIDIECKYTIKSSVKLSKKDWVGLFKVGWQSSGEHFTYQWSPYIQSEQEERKATANRVVFHAKYLPKSDEEFYQFCYVTSSGEIRGASVPFQIKNKTDASDFEFCEVEDDESMLMIKNRTAILEESLSRALEENSSLKVSKEKAVNEVERLNDVVVSLEKRKSELTAQLNHERKQNSFLSKELESVNNELKAKTEILGIEKSKKEELEVEVAKLENDKKEMVAIVEHSNKKCQEFAEIVEKEQMQSSEVQKSKEKLVGEKLQYLQKIAENRELTDNLTSELSKKEEEIATLKVNLAATISRQQKDLSEQEALCTKLKEEISKNQQEFNKEKTTIQDDAAKLKEELKTALIKLEGKQRELNDINDVVQNLTSKVKSLEKEKDDLMEANISETRHFETRIQVMMEERLIQDEALQRIECELEDAKEKFELEKGKNTALEEDYESTVRALEHQLEGERALNRSLCSQTDNTVAELQTQLEHQLQVNNEQNMLLETKTAELKTTTEELETHKKNAKSLQEKLNLINAQLSATDNVVSALKTEKEVLQTTLSDSQVKTEKQSNNSAASMYALQTAHAHLEKKYVEAKKKVEELWKDKNELKRTLAVVQGSLSATDMRHEVEEFRRKNEDLRVRLNMGAEAYKVKFIECRRLENQLKKLQKAQLEGNNQTPTRPKQDGEQKNVSTMRAELEAEKEAGKQKDVKIDELKQEVRLLSQEVESLSTQRVNEESLQMTSYAQQLEADLTDRQNRLTEIEEMFNNEKKEKHNLIEEIMNLQEQMRTHELEKVINDDEIKRVKELLTREQGERDNLGEMARQRIQALEEQVRSLNEEVERWKKEVDNYVEAEAKAIGSSHETSEQAQQTSPEPQRSPFQWPWNRNGQFQQSNQWIQQQPFVWVQSQDCDPSCPPPPTNPQYQPAPAPTPPQAFPHLPSETPMQSMNGNHECPICKILFPPSATLEKITEHVNKHLDETEHSQ